MLSNTLIDIPYDHLRNGHRSHRHHENHFAEQRSDDDCSHHRHHRHHHHHHHTHRHDDHHNINISREISNCSVSSFSSSSNFANFRVKYLGSLSLQSNKSFINRKRKSINDFQRPLLELYSLGQRKHLRKYFLFDHNHIFDQVATVSNYGIAIIEQNKSCQSELKFRDAPSVIKVISPITSVINWAAIRFTLKQPQNEKEKSIASRAGFLPLSCSTSMYSDKSFMILTSKQRHLVNLIHPPLFMCVQKSATKSKTIELHLFVCQTVEDASNICVQISSSKYILPPLSMNILPLLSNNTKSEYLSSSDSSPIETTTTSESTDGLFSGRYSGRHSRVSSVQKQEASSTSTPSYCTQLLGDTCESKQDQLRKTLSSSPYFSSSSLSTASCQTATQHFTNYRVKYLGSMNSHFTKKSLTSKKFTDINDFQKPLLQIYSNAQRKSIRKHFLLNESSFRFNQMITISNYGLVVAENAHDSFSSIRNDDDDEINSRRELPNEIRNTIVTKVITPVNSIVHWAGIKFTSKSISESRKSSSRAGFIPLACSDDILTKRSFAILSSKQRFLFGLDHPPLFMCIQRQITSPKLFECHLFICESSETAINLCNQLFYAQQQMLTAKITALRLPPPGKMGIYSFQQQNVHRMEFTKSSSETNNETSDSDALLSSLNHPLSQRYSRKLELKRNAMKTILNGLSASKNLDQYQRVHKSENKITRKSRNFYSDRTTPTITEISSCESCSKCTDITTINSDSNHSNHRSQESKKLSQETQTRQQQRTEEPTRHHHHHHHHHLPHHYPISKLRKTNQGWRKSNYVKEVDTKDYRDKEKLLRKHKAIDKRERIVNIAAVDEVDQRKNQLRNNRNMINEKLFKELNDKRSLMLRSPATNVSSLTTRSEAAANVVHPYTEPIKRKQQAVIIDHRLCLNTGNQDVIKNVASYSPLTLIERNEKSVTPISFVHSNLDLRSRYEANAKPIQFSRSSREIPRRHL